MDNTILIVATGAVVAGFVQGLSGFAFGLVAMSFWIWNIDPALAAVLVVYGSLQGQLLAALTALRSRRQTRWRQVLPFIAGGLAGIPLGVWLLPMINPDLFKLALGLLLAIWCPAMLLMNRLPRLRFEGAPFNGVIGVIGGFMGGIGGFSGVIPTLWCNLRGMEKEEQRAIIQNFNLAMQTVTMLLYLWHGMITRQMLPLLGVVAVCVFLPSLLGARLYHRISATGFRRIVLSFLTLSGIALLAASLPRLLA